jgi:ribosomal protein S18 acetylase RimI-like enzyme
VGDLSAVADQLIRPVTESDVDRVVALVHELADYERAADSCHLTAEQLRTALFGPQPALFGFVAQDSPEDPEVVGVALRFRNFSTWDGVHGIHLEDLYVTPTRRGRGHGRALLAALARECGRQGYSRLEWNVLTWNEPAIGFYRSLGAEPLTEWRTFRLTDEPLRALGDFLS